MNQLSLVPAPDSTGGQYNICDAEFNTHAQAQTSLIEGRESVVFISKNTIFAWSAIGHHSACGDDSHQIDLLIAAATHTWGDLKIVARGVARFRRIHDRLECIVGDLSVATLYCRIIQKGITVTAEVGSYYIDLGQASLIDYLLRHGTNGNYSMLVHSFRDAMSVGFPKPTK